MAKKTKELTSPNELSVAVEEAKEELLREEAILEQLNEVRASINEILDSMTNLSGMVADHEARLHHLGNDARPIPATIFGDINLGQLFGQISAQVISGMIQQFPHSKNNEPSIRDYAKTSILAASVVIEEILKKKEDSHQK